MSVGAGTGYTIEQLLEMLSCEVARERHLVGVHVEANRTLEAMLRREQQQRQEAVSYVDYSNLSLAMLRCCLNGLG